MRGLDFRADGVSICLVIAKSFSCDRAADQGLARVGRFGDRCERLLVGGVPLVDRVSAMREEQKLLAYMETRTRVHQLQTLPSERQVVGTRGQTKKQQTRQGAPD